MSEESSIAFRFIVDTTCGGLTSDVHYIFSFDTWSLNKYGTDIETLDLHDRALINHFGRILDGRNLASSVAGMNSNPEEMVL